MLPGLQRKLLRKAAGGRLATVGPWPFTVVSRNAPQAAPSARAPRKCGPGREDTGKALHAPTSPRATQNIMYWPPPPLMQHV